MSDGKKFVVKRGGDILSANEWNEADGILCIAVDSIEAECDELEVTIKPRDSKRMQKIFTLLELLGDERDGTLDRRGESETLGYYVDALEAIDREDG